MTTTVLIMTAMSVTSDPTTGASPLPPYPFAPSRSFWPPSLLLITFPPLLFLCFSSPLFPPSFSLTPPQSRVQQVSAHRLWPVPTSSSPRQLWLDPSSSSTPPPCGPPSHRPPELPRPRSSQTSHDAPATTTAVSTAPRLLLSCSSFHSSNLPILEFGPDHLFFAHSVNFSFQMIRDGKPTMCFRASRPSAERVKPIPLSSLLFISFAWSFGQRFRWSHSETPL